MRIFMTPTKKQTMSLSQTSGRDYGIDLLKLTAMFLVVLLHTLSHGVVTAASPLSPNYDIGFLLEAFAYCCVNCFALASGYIGVDARFRHRNIIPLWLQSVFYSLCITAVFMYIKPAEYYLDTVGDSPLKTAVTPITSCTYWYLTAYFALFFFIPFLNIALSKLTERQAFTLILSIIFLYIIIPSITNRDLFLIGVGYNSTWIILLYVLGASLKKLNLQKIIKKNWIFLVSYLLFSFLAWFGKYYTEHHSFAEGELKINDTFIQYTSLPILLSSMSLLLFFAGIKVTNDRAQSIIRRLAAASFGVYLIHVHPLVFQLPFWSEKLGALAAKPIPTMIFGVLCYAIGIYTICIVIDLIRGILFQIFRIKNAVNFVCEKINNSMKGNGVK